MKSREKFDVVILGGGIGGLICGTYLSKAGKKVVIVEKNSKAGGYCQSFEKNGFVFNAGPHIFGSCNTNGLLYRILEELDVKESFIKERIVDRYTFNNYIIQVPQNIDEYIELLVGNFKNEKDNIYRYFDALFDIAGKFLKKTLGKKEAKLSYKELLDSFINTPDLKCILSAHCGYLGVLPDSLSCVAMAMTEWSYFKEGTYKFKKDSDDFVNSILHKFFEYGGILKLNEEGKRLILNKDNSNSHLVISQTGNSYYCHKLVINIDPLKFYNYVDERNMIGKKFSIYLNKYVFSPSFLIAYIGIKSAKNLDWLSGWHFASYNLDDILTKTYYINIKGNEQKENRSVHVIKFCFRDSNTPNSKEKWAIDVSGMLKKLLKKTPWELKVSISADPSTLEKWTNNRHGSAYGYSMIPSQAYSNIFNRLLNTNNIYFVGHWSTFGGGIVPTALSGKIVAEIIGQNRITKHIREKKKYELV